MRTTKKLYQFQSDATNSNTNQQTAEVDVDVEGVEMR